MGLLMYVVTVVFDAVPGKEEAFAARVARQARDSLALEDDCHVFTVSRDLASATRFFLYEEYTDEAAFQSHLNSPHFRLFGEECADMVRHKMVETFSRFV